MRSRVSVLEGSGAMPTSIGKYELLDEPELKVFSQWLKDNGANIGLSFSVPLLSSHYLGHS
jgi:hypothetical protein